jgi:hypothetical protein
MAQKETPDENHSVLQKRHFGRIVKNSYKVLYW